MCSSYLTTTQLVGCPCFSWSSLSVSQFHGSMVSHTSVSVIFLRILFPYKNGHGIKMSLFLQPKWDI